VYETFNPGAVKQIWVTLPGERRAYVSQENAPREGSRALSFEFACTNAPVSSVRVLVDSLSVYGWNDIDSVAVVP
jgi:hypothetical protein